MQDVLSVFVVVGGLWVLIGFTADSIAQAVVRRKYGNDRRPATLRPRHVRLP